MYRLWRLNGLALPPYRPSRKIKIGAKVGQLALRRNDVWAWDLVHDRYHDQQKLRCLTVKDEATGYCLAMDVKPGHPRFVGNVLQPSDRLTDCLTQAAAPAFRHGLSTKPTGRPTRDTQTICH